MTHTTVEHAEHRLVVGETTFRRQLRVHSVSTRSPNVLLQRLVHLRFSRQLSHVDPGLKSKQPVDHERPHDQDDSTQQSRTDHVLQRIRPSDLKSADAT